MNTKTQFWLWFIVSAVCVILFAFVVGKMAPGHSEPNTSHTIDNAQGQSNISDEMERFILNDQPADLRNEVMPSIASVDCHDWDPQKSIVLTCDYWSYNKNHAVVTYNIEGWPQVQVMTVNAG